jgi:four helix bundle protein
MDGRTRGRSSNTFGSLKELETHLLLAKRVGLLTQATLDPPLVQTDAIGKMLRSLIRALQRREAS